MNWRMVVQQVVGIVGGAVGTAIVFGLARPLKAALVAAPTSLAPAPRSAGAKLAVWIAVAAATFFVLSYPDQAGAVTQRSFDLIEKAAMALAGWIKSYAD
jgi:hypothetical protein